MATTKNAPPKARHQKTTKTVATRTRSTSKTNHIDPKKNEDKIAVLLAECDARSLSKPEKVAVLMAQGVSRRKARIMAGYKSGTANPPAAERKAVETVDQARARLAQQKGYRFEDSARFYAKKSTKSDVCDSDQIRARTRLDNLMGHDAPQKQEIVHRNELRAAIMVLSNLDITPTDIANSPNVSGMCTVQDGGEDE